MILPSCHGNCAQHRQACPHPELCYINFDGWAAVGIGLCVLSAILVILLLVWGANWAGWWK